MRTSPEQPKPLTLQLVNGLFLKYLAQRRLTDMYRGDLQIRERRRECLELVEWISQWDPHELTWEFDQLKRAFDEAMARIPDPL